jgi:hypothetical protein
MQAFQKATPYAVGVVVFMLLVFALYVRSVPPVTPAAKILKSPVDAATLQQDIQAKMDESVPDFLKVNPVKADASQAPEAEL